MTKVSINIKSGFGTFLNTREAATSLCKVITHQNASSVELDLACVEFMSRSFADQFYKERQVLREKGISVFLINSGEEIEKILEVVGRTQHKQDKESDTINVERFTNITDASKYLPSI